MSLHIQNARLIDPAACLDHYGDLVVVDGKIAFIGVPPDDRPITATYAIDRTINAKGCIIMPGGVDLCARLRPLDKPCHGLLAGEVKAAHVGGITHMVCPPDAGLVQPQAISDNGHIYPLGPLTVALKGEALTDIAAYLCAGCIGVSQANKPVRDTMVLYHALQYARTLDTTVWLPARDPHIGIHGVAHRGAIATRLGLPDVPVISETIALHTIIELVRATGARIHIGRLSYARSVDILRAAKQEGLPITCDIGAHYLHLSAAAIGFFDINAHVIPPFRDEADVIALRQGVLDGTIDAICSDHHPLTPYEKNKPFAQSIPGTTGLELLLSLTLKWALEAKIALPQALAKITSDAARVANLSAGTLAIGSQANLCLVDPDRVWKVTAETLTSQGKSTPFLGMTLPGRIMITMVDGQIVFER